LHRHSFVSATHCLPVCLPARPQALSRELGELSGKHSSLLQQLAECQGRVAELQQEAAGLQDQEGQGAAAYACCLAPSYMPVTQVATCQQEVQLFGWISTVLLDSRHFSTLLLFVTVKGACR
jgi:hypothetical protein